MGILIPDLVGKAAAWRGKVRVLETEKLLLIWSDHDRRANKRK